VERICINATSPYISRRLKRVTADSSACDERRRWPVYRKTALGTGYIVLTTSRYRLQSLNLALEAVTSCFCYFAANTHTHTRARARVEKRGDAELQSQRGFIMSSN
jgi:hypothetical protein